MMNPYNETYFGDNYYDFGENVNQNRQQMRPQLQPKQDMIYANRQPNHPNNCRPIGPNPNHSYYRRSQPYYGQKPNAFGGQYRAQVIDYSNGSQRQPFNEPMVRMPSNPQQMRTIDSNPYSQQRQQNFQNGRQLRPQTRPLMSSPNTGLLPIPNQSNQQHFGSLPPHPQHLNTFSPNYSIPPPIPHSYSQNMSHSVPQPVPPPVPLPVPPPPPPVPSTAPQSMSKPQPNANQSKPKVEDNMDSRFNKLFSEGMQNKVQNDFKGFYCLFCEMFCNSLNSAERHVESPKHQRTKIGDNLKGIDAKYTIKSERIRETSVALARREELNKISNVIKNDYFNEGIRLKDGIGSEAYVCENCGVFADSLSAVNKHLELHKQFAEQLKICSKPVIGLDFIVEYIDPEPSKPRIYECIMCRTFTSTRDIITHVCSFTHRSNFIKKIHPSEGMKYTSETQQLSLEAGKRALELETLVGRGQFKVKNQSAPQNCLSKSVSFNNNVVEPPKQMPTPKPVPPTPAPKQMSKPVIQIEIPKPKAEHEKSEIEKLFSVRLNSESEANEVTKIITNITTSVMEYHMKGMTPEMRQKFRQEVKDNEQNLNNFVKKQN